MKDPDERREMAIAVRRFRELEMENEAKAPAAVACRVLGFSERAYYQWLRKPVSAREAG